MVMDPDEGAFTEQLVHTVATMIASLEDVITVRSWLSGTAHCLHVPIDPAARQEFEARLAQLAVEACKPVHR